MSLQFKPTVPLLYYAAKSGYVPGVGAGTVWEKILPDALYCEWKGGYGDRALTAQSLGVSDMATVRTFYHPSLFLKLKAVKAVVVKNADVIAIKNGVPDKNNPNVYELWGGVDNVGEANQFMEFRVRRYEAK